jgi:hypothetical protein
LVPVTNAVTDIATAIVTVSVTEQADRAGRAPNERWFFFPAAVEAAAKGLERLRPARDHR